MHPDVNELAELLDRAKALLSKCGEEHWAQWLAKDSALIKKLDLYGIEHLLSAFGGMGSINDLVIHPANGHSVRDADIGNVNELLQALLEKIFALAKRLYGEEANARRGT
jgi:hypothetical protein